MTVEMVNEILMDMFTTSLYILIPIFAASLIVGVMISIFQAATSIQEMTLTFVPKILVTVIVVIIMIPFIAEKLMSLTMRYFNMITTVSR